MNQTPRRQEKARLAAVLLLVAGCAKPAAPPPPPAPAPEPEPPPAVVAPAPAVAAVAGRYRLAADVPRRQARGRARGTPATPLTLQAAVARSPDGMTAVSRQYVATATIPGYAAAARGRESAWWWPIAGDSVVIHLILRDGNRLQLRGAVSRTVLRGEVWFMSGQTGTTYQLGTFTATRTR